MTSTLGTSKSYPSLRKRCGGFTLVEMLAAFALFAIGFGVMMEMTSSSLRNARVGADMSEAALWAQSKMDVAGIEEPLAPGSKVGEFDRKYRWEMNVTEWEPPADAAQLDIDGAGATQVVLFQIELIVRWGQGDRERRARFVTLRAIQPNQPG
ncbi:MAG: prepilin-type N-terminal cleavage/methylation domain-containing protein [Pseudomonadota bacterium]|nr:prepilin-type N-terminal cleavage/methylation domain-containing protein [Pseudomonadota bacterium]